jgi:hypothetical protein
VSGFNEAQTSAATTVGERLVLATDWQNGSNGTLAVWATAVTPN